jgi:hypothetical protein
MLPTGAILSRTRAARGDTWHSVGEGARDQRYDLPAKIDWKQLKDMIEARRS